MNDYNHIYTTNANGRTVKYTVSEMQKLHRRGVNFIKKVVSKYKNSKHKVILITHHKPVDGDIKEKDRDVLTQAYQSDQSDIMKPPIRYSIFGHTHVHYNRTIKGIRYLSNPKGYIGQHTSFIKDLTFKV